MANSMKCPHCNQSKPFDDMFICPAHFQEKYPGESVFSIEWDLVALKVFSVANCVGCIVKKHWKCEIDGEKCPPIELGLIIETSQRKKLLAEIAKTQEVEKLKVSFGNLENLIDEVIKAFYAKLDRVFDRTKLQDRHPYQLESFKGLVRSFDQVLGKAINDQIQAANQLKEITVKLEDNESHLLPPPSYVAVQDAPTQHLINRNNDGSGKQFITKSMTVKLLPIISSEQHAIVVINQSNGDLLMKIVPTACQVTHKAYRLHREKTLKLHVTAPKGFTAESKVQISCVPVKTQTIPPEIVLIKLPQTHMD